MKRNGSSRPGARLARLEANFEMMHAEVARVGDGLESLARELREQTKTPWANLAAWAGLVLVICGMLGASVSFVFFRDLTRVEAGFAELASAVAHKSVEFGQVQQSVAENKRAIPAMDIHLQEEMRILDATQKSRLDILTRDVSQIRSKLYQHETQAAHPQMLERHEGLKEHVMFRLEQLENKIHGQPGPRPD